MKTYQGTRNGYAKIVTVNGRPLNPRLDLHDHSPTGFEWGYLGGGPAQLALALLADVLENDAVASRWHQDFEKSVVAKLPHNGWSLTDEQIRQSAQAIVAG